MRFRLQDPILLLALGLLLALPGCQPPAADRNSTESEQQLDSGTGAPSDSAMESTGSSTGSRSDMITDADAESPAAVEYSRQAPAPQSLTLPAQTVLLVEMASGLSSHTSQPGEAFRARVAQEVSVSGRLAVPVGSSVYGKVTEAHPANKIGGRAKLALVFHTLELPGGEPVAIAASFDLAGKSQRTKDAAMIGGGVVGGAILGDQVDEGKGTAIGAIIGGLAGTAAAKKTRGKPVQVPAGTMLTLTLTQPVTVQARG